MITRQALKQLQFLSNVPALSILLSTHRTSPDNKQDPIRVKNLVDEATKRLATEFTNHELEPLLKRLETLVSELTIATRWMDWRYTSAMTLPSFITCLFLYLRGL
ncbi:hypothetical protein [Nostoc sp. TCL240-02]|uniref:hypothetical protein n=1 Tax=Nostoc sp. TCL240-02 TaxID=2572090 RepID=UPI001C2DFF18|nr:hypothetical protein [Nostoc sp. TCL240-02]